MNQTREIVADDTLAFAGIEPARLRLYPVASHIAEKLHAYTMPRARPNSRIKDLPDIALLATTGAILAAVLRSALERTFEFRGTHELPEELPPPPATWGTAYEAMAKSEELIWPTLEELHRAVRMFLEPVLSTHVRANRWNPRSWSWTRSR